MIKLDRSRILAATVGLFTLAVLHNAKAATIKIRTLQAWDDRVAQSMIKLTADRCDPGRFVATAEGKATAKPVAVDTAPGAKIWGGMSGVSAGLIHHWTGIVFIPNAHADDLLRTLQDYDGYSDIFKPAVVESK